jgi:16S rRNA (guanine527-N7)-methyltransferase
VALDEQLRLLGIDIGRDARSGIETHVRFLIAWNAAINLTSVRDPVEIAVRHVVDSLLGVALLRREGIDRFVDLGSGGGFPAIPLALALPADRLLLVESVAKKTRFLRVVLTAVGRDLSAAVATDRAESIGRQPGDRGRWPAVTARAVASLAELVELAFPLLRPDGVLVAWKSGDPDDETGLGAELAATARAIDALAPDRSRERRRTPGGPAIEVGPPVAATSPGASSDAIAASLRPHRLILVRRGRWPLPESWPRDPANRRRRPW